MLEQQQKIKDLNRNTGEQYFIINGDFNAKSTIWTHKCNKKGDIVTKWIENNNLNVINNGAPTHCSKANKNESAIDLTIVSDNAVSLGNCWYVDQETKRHGISDHYIIGLDF